MRKELRKPFTGTPQPWMASVPVTPSELPYLLDPPDRITHCQTRQESMSFLGIGGDTPQKRTRDRKRWQGIRREQPSVVIDPNLVIFSSPDDAFYRFSHFTAKYAIFKYLAPNDGTLKSR